MRVRTKITDFHAHILPCADHGSDSLKVSLSQLALINNAGVSTVVATPHFYPELHTVKQFTDTVSAAAEELIASSPEARPQICLGAEVLYFDGIEDMEELHLLCIRGTNVLMLELPLADWSRGIVYSVKRLTQRYTVVLAHIDRYINLCPDIIDALLSVGALAQINASALSCGAVKRKLMPYIKNGQVYALGSDLHGIDTKAYKKFSKAEKRLGSDFEDIMVRSELLLDKALKY